MSDSTSERPEAVPAPPLPAGSPTAAPTPTPPVPGARRPGKRTRVIAAAVAVLLMGGGVAYWALSGDGDPMDHVEVSDGKLVVDDSDSYDDSDDEYCDDTDIYSFNDCDTDDDTEPESTYEFVYKITNKGDEPANYSILVNAFDKDGDYVGQTYIGAEHLAAGETDADKSEFTSYGTFEDRHELSDIASVKVAYVERMALAN
ncbi:FxLYD domain-containing protein [Streptomyces griseoincarnatus]|uniref:FxLYD domain-containing protein n=1 Tax=Streptomyces sp. PAM3C TaxID=2847300 RepID=UPI001C1E6491|nr:FxLYD domain-containing protein [Streptomyces sp. PAM3C]MBU5945653.1 FxLYD domain-containing protein [Streptomyces sp. PAM3C]